MPIGFGVCPASAVGFAAMLDGGDFEGVGGHVKADAVVADAESGLGRVDILQALHVALGGGGPVVGPKSHHEPEESVPRSSHCLR